MGIWLDHGAFLQTAPTAGAAPCALLPGPGGAHSCTMDATGASAAAAALLHAPPVNHIDSQASSQVRPIPTPPFFFSPPLYPCTSALGSCSPPIL